MRNIALFVLLLVVVAGIPLPVVSAETEIENTAPAERNTIDCNSPDCVSGRVDDCVIPESGPWPDCATTKNQTEDDSCIIPESGPWPTCATGEAEAVTINDCIIPESGPWPPCATGEAAPPPHEECIKPESGPWPPCVSEAPEHTDEYITWRVNEAADQLTAFWQAELGWRQAARTELEHFELYYGAPGDVPNAYYVPDLDAIFVDVRLLTEVVDLFGEYAAVAVVAHEWGHFAQDALGILDLTRPRRDIELQGDCLTGAFTQHLKVIGALNPGEYESAARLFYASGDDQLSPDTPVPAPNQHGTGEERRAAYDLGFRRGVQTCIDSY